MGLKAELIEPRSPRLGEKWSADSSEVEADAEGRAREPRNKGVFGQRAHPESEREVGRSEEEKTKIPRDNRSPIQRSISAE